MKMKTVNNLIIEEALKDIGIEEVPGNKGWKPRFVFEDLIDPEKEYTEEEKEVLEEKANIEAEYVENFQSNIEKLGWKEGWAWCMFWAESVWLRAYEQYNSFIVNKLKDLISPSAVKTWENFNDDDSIIIEKTPVIGAIALWQKQKEGEKHWTGHGAIVYSFNHKTFSTIDGNTSKTGSREGLIVGKVTRKYNFKVHNGLQLLGFIHPPL